MQTRPVQNLYGLRRRLGRRLPGDPLAHSILMRVFLDNLELYLTVAGLLVVWATAAALGTTGFDGWTVAAITALAVSVLHGAIFWVVRRRQRMIRAAMVHDIREMLADQVLNQLSVMKMWMPDGDEKAAFEYHFAEISDSIDSVATMVDELSEERVRMWQKTYANASEHIAFRPAAA